MIYIYYSTITGYLSYSNNAPTKSQIKDVINDELVILKIEDNKPTVFEPIDCNDQDSYGIIEQLDN